MTKEQIWQEWWPKQPGITEDNLTALRRGFMAGYDFGFVEGYKEADTLTKRGTRENAKLPTIGQDVRDYD